MPDDGYRYDLIDGELRKMSPPGGAHGFVAMEVAMRLADHVRRHQLGQVFAAETGFRIRRNPDTVLAPDVSFVRKERIAAHGITDEYFPEAPALVVEVVSPGDTAEEVDDKIQRWFAAGVELGWVVYPKRHTVTVYRGLDDIRVLKTDDMLDGGSVVPGFSCRVGDLFADLVSK
jgi:Uma2 family endonuclease